jgi:hypothetical protein
MCQNCMAFYEDRDRAKRCHEGYIIDYDVSIFQRKSCSGSYKHLYTNKATGKRINYCYYCSKQKNEVKPNSSQQ